MKHVLALSILLFTACSPTEVKTVPAPEPAPAPQVTETTPPPPPDKEEEVDPHRALPENHPPVRGGRPYLGLVPDYSFDGTGVLLQGVGEGSPAEKAGLREGDVITAFNGEPIEDIQEYSPKFFATRPGDRIVLTVLRGEEKREVDVPVETRSSEE